MDGDLQMPDVVASVASFIVGSEWPKGSETGLWQLQEAWGEGARHLHSLAGELGAAGGGVLDSVDGRIAEEFRDFVGDMERLVPGLADSAGQMRDLSGRTALQVEYAKAMIITQAIITFLQVLHFLLFGLPEAASLALTGGRIAVREVLQHLLVSVGTGIALGEVSDIAVQVGQFLAGHRHQWDTDATVSAVESGAIGGAVGGITFGVARQVKPRFAEALLGKLALSAVSGGVTEGITYGIWGDETSAFGTAITSGFLGGLEGGRRFRFSKTYREGGYARLNDQDAVPRLSALTSALTEISAGVLAALGLGAPLTTSTDSHTGRGGGASTGSGAGAGARPAQPRTVTQRSGLGLDTIKSALVAHVAAVNNERATSRHYTAPATVPRGSATTTPASAGGRLTTDGVPAASTAAGHTASLPDWPGRSRAASSAPTDADWKDVVVRRKTDSATLAGTNSPASTRVPAAGGAARPGDSSPVAASRRPDTSAGVPDAEGRPVSARGSVRTSAGPQPAVRPSMTPTTTFSEGGLPGVSTVLHPRTTGAAAPAGAPDTGGPTPRPAEAHLSAAGTVPSVPGRDPRPPAVQGPIPALDHESIRADLVYREVHGELSRQLAGKDASSAVLAERIEASARVVAAQKLARSGELSEALRTVASAVRTHGLSQDAVLRQAVTRAGHIVEGLTPREENSRRPGVATAHLILTGRPMDAPGGPSAPTREAGRGTTESSPVGGASEAAAVPRRHTDPADAGPITERNVVAAASRLASKATADNCVDLVASFLAHMFPHGVRAPGVRDDLDLVPHRAESTIAPGATWSKVMSVHQVVRALSENEHEAVAVLLRQRDKGAGHALLYARVKEPEAGGWKILRVDVQAGEHAITDLSADFLTKTNAPASSPSLRTDHDWLRAGRGTRMVVIDRTGLAVDPKKFSTDVLVPESSSSALALTDAPVGRGYGAIGWEIEITDHRIVPADKETKLPPGMWFAKHEDGTVLKRERKRYWVADGRGFLSETEATTYGGGEVKAGMMTIIELESPVHRALDGEVQRPNMELGISQSLAVLDQLREATTNQRAVALSDILRDGWTHNPQAPKLVVYPSIAGPHYRGPYTQITIGSHIGGANLILALGQDLISTGKPHQAPVVAAARDFADDVATAYAARVLRRQVETAEMPFLFPVVPGLHDAYAYAWLMFSHASAGPIMSRFYPGKLVKNLLPIVLRNPFYAVRASLHAEVTHFMLDNEEFIYGRFRSRLLEEVEVFKQLTRIDPASVEDVMNDAAFTDATVQDYLTSMIRYARVSNYDMVGTRHQSYENLDSDNGELPLALFEFRSLPHMDTAALSHTIRQVRSVAVRAHETAQKFQQWDPSRTRPLAVHVLAHPLVRHTRELLSRLAELRDPHPSQGHGRLLTHLDRLDLARAVTEHAVSGSPLPEATVRHINAIQAKLAEVHSPESVIPLDDRAPYDAALRGLDIAMAIHDSQAHNPPAALPGPLHGSATAQSNGSIPTLLHDPAALTNFPGDMHPAPAWNVGLDIGSDVGLEAGNHPVAGFSTGDTQAHVPFAAVPGLLEVPAWTYGAAFDAAALPADPSELTALLGDTHPDPAWHFGADFAFHGGIEADIGPVAGPSTGGAQAHVPFATVPGFPEVPAWPHGDDYDAALPADTSDLTALLGDTTWQSWGAGWDAEAHPSAPHTESEA
ncbi:hypothetical protein [Streptomyces sp. NPDC051014]|uniref:WXG100-like domain-containing protein n=1 Tax=Streptomyces sp. NPDC051014 TaxID=3155751 RepID=UPI0033F30A4E